ncbi:HNH endonuclease signature motif containing protein [Kutzneria sp. 744]|uniref:HNH endonuclease n=1 Tax=Kutzneria sp. (strain 744) TaxID=345341 RepID=UPI0005B9F111|nr:HNH endonuclease signature motif containing protein [Kutzneria sp. 744]
MRSLLLERTVHMGDPSLVAKVEDGLVGVAAGLNRSQLARRATKLVAQVDPEGYQRRCRSAEKERRVEFKPLPDGMAQIKAILPAVQASMAQELLRQDVAGLPADERSTDQKRADAFLERFLGNAREREVQVHVTVPMETLLGLTEEPGLLDGYGPIAAGMARELAMRGPWRGVLLDEYRHAVAMSTKKYRPTARMREMVKVQDGGVCTAPGCTSPIRELDHVIPWPKGKTTAKQLKGLCAWHHHRNHDNYRVTLDAEGSARWTTPLGRSHTVTPHRY